MVAAVAAGQTTAWDIPKRDTDAQGAPIGTDWFVSVDARCDKVLTAAERGAVE